MSPLREVPCPASSLHSAVRTAALVAALLLTGCAQSRDYRHDAAYVRAPIPPAAMATAPKIEIEDDGLPAQTPPPRRVRQEPDDPSEPFSPNYGSGGTRTPEPAPRLSARSAASYQPPALHTHWVSAPDPRLTRSYRD